MIPFAVLSALQLPSELTFSAALIMAPLLKALGLSVILERILELAKNAFEPFVGAPRAEQRVPRLDEARKKVEELSELLAADRGADAAETAAEAPKRREERKRLSKDLDEARTALLTTRDQATRSKHLQRIQEVKADLRKDEAQGEWDENLPPETIIVQKATDPDDGWTLRTLVIQLIGVSLGIVLARSSGIRLFEGLLTGTNATPTEVWMDFLLTGLLISGGSAPIHELIRFLTVRVQPPPEPAASPDPGAQPSAPAAVATAAAPAVLTAPRVDADDWVEIPYTGGVDRERLEAVHLRPADPSMIVYHHTAMDSRTGFDDVVRVIKDRKDANGRNWLTGYNCVILADGSVHPFCRWDRYGSHAVGYNRDSLGISFNGNFETNPLVPFSNPDGRMGPSRPTTAQLEAGARVVALWTFLYDIKADFDKVIIPHKQIASKACPGSNFPYERFQALVKFYRQRWAQPGLARDRIAAFNERPFLHVQKGRP